MVNLISLGQVLMVSQEWPLPYEYIKTTKLIIMTKISWIHTTLTSAFTPGPPTNKSLSHTAEVINMGK